MALQNNCYSKKSTILNNHSKVLAFYYHITPIWLEVLLFTNKVTNIQTIYMKGFLNKRGFKKI